MSNYAGQLVNYKYNPKAQCGWHILLSELIYTFDTCCELSFSAGRNFFAGIFQKLSNYDVCETLSTYVVSKIKKNIFELLQV